MSRKRKHREKPPPPAIPRADWLPPESSPHEFYSQLAFTNADGGSGPLCIVGRELQLVWYETERDRDRERNGKLVCVLDFQYCRKSRDHRGNRYEFAGLLLEDMSGDYRQWLGRQAHLGRAFGNNTDVRETEIQFSVAVQERIEGLLSVQAPATAPFLLHHPDVEELSSPQLDMLFDVMSFLYGSIPAMKTMEDLRTQRIEDCKLVQELELAESQ
jgi:hypothetical protein